ncbi:MAG: peptide-methionine (S)-S-oxide reductase MsrA [Parabacteroides sp.]
MSGQSFAVFAGGCFWGVQHQMERLKGVKRTLVGYTGGEEEFPQYADVRDHHTHHVEAVLVEYDAHETTYTDLCKLFFEIHDPAQTDGVGPDIGQQYRSCIFYANSQQKQEAEAVVDILRHKGYEVNTLLLPLGNFWIGEEYHQRYYEKTGGEPYCHVRTKKF